MNQIVSPTPRASSPATSLLQSFTHATATDVRAPLKFIVPQDTKPVLQSAALTGGAPVELFDVDGITVPITDMRPFTGDISVDLQGFALLDHATAVDDLYDDAAVATVYRHEIEELLKHRLGAGRVVVFDATRRSDGGAGSANLDGRRGPASRIHVDYTEKSGPARLRDVIGTNEAERLAAAGTRVAQVNVWRPIKGPVMRSPLALADATSIDADQLVATDQIFPDRVGEIYHLAHAPGQRWYYASAMRRDEVLLIKGWDSLHDGRARFTPHTAFSLPETSPDTPPRESIESRTFVIFD